jgi:hypothetical protein
MIRKGDLMRESELQEMILNMIEKGTFYSYIQRKEDIDHIVSLDNNPKYIPNLSIDYMLRHRYAKGAKQVLKAINGELKIINGKQIRNISLDKNDKLLPDFIVVNDEINKMLLMELKGNKQTEREALTELWAYSQEIKNQLPFLTSHDLYYVIISSEFNTLLDHSIGGIVLESSFNVLCLKVGTDKGRTIVSVHIPDSWTDLRIAHIPPDAFSSLSISLYEKEDSSKLSEVDCETILENAIDILTYEANRNNAHGFCIGWKNVNTNVYVLTFYEINPYELSKYFLRERNELNTGNPFFRYIHNELADTAAYESMFQLAQTTFEYLELYFLPNWESLTDWYSDQIHISRCGIPYMMGYWGVINDFIRFYYMHPGIRQYMPEFTKHHITYKYPIVGVQFLHYLLGTNLFKDGLFSPKDIFKFGQTLNLCLQYAYFLCNSDQTTESYFVARFNWLSFELFPAIREVGERARLLVKEPSNSVRVVLSHEQPEETINTILQLRTWFTESFLGDNNREAQHFFDQGFSNGFILDREFFNELGRSNDEEIQLAKQQLLFFFQHYLQPIGSDEEILKEFEIKNFDTVNITIEDLFENQEQYLNLFNRYYHSIIQDLNEFSNCDVSVLDWEWLKDQTYKIRMSTNQRVAIDITSSGQVSIVRVPDTEFTPKVNHETEVLVRTAITSHLVVYIVRKWDDLRGEIQSLGTT